MSLPPSPIGFDASVLINFCAAGRVDLIVQVCESPRIVLVDVIEEIEDATCRSQIQDRIDAGEFELHSLEADEELELWAEYTLRLDAGESATLAAARHRKWAVAIDERAARHTAESELGTDRLTGTVGLLRAALDAGLIDSAEANRLLKLMVDAGYWSPVQEIP